MATAAPALALDDVTCRFAARDGGSAYTAVANATLHVGVGEFVSVVGPTGCGKSTLLNVAAGLLEPSSGTVSVFGERLRASAGVNKRAGYMFQADALMPWRHILDNATLGLEVQGMSRVKARAKVLPLLPDFGLQGFERHYPAQLSGGMRQRAALLRTVVQEREMPNVSASWNASLPMRRVETWPVRATMGMESIMASTRPVVRLVAPGPEVAQQTPGLPVARAYPPAAKAAFSS